MEEDFTKRLDNEIIALVKTKIHGHTCQILKKGGQFGYKPHGSGVFVDIEHQSFLFTASHVLEDIATENLYVNSQRGMIEIFGDVKQTNLDKHNNIDVGYILLDPELVKVLKGYYWFLPQTLLRKQYDDGACMYLSLGYPEVNIKAEPENKIIRTGSAFAIHPLSKDHVYTYYKYDKALHYVLEYSGKGTDMVTNQKKKINIQPHGISGGGLWHVAVYEDENGKIELDYRLIGTMTEFKRGKYFVLVANKIELVLSALNTFHGIRT